MRRRTVLFIFTDKSMKKILLIGAVLMAVLAVLSNFSDKDDTPLTQTEDQKLETLLASIDGVEQASVAFYYSEDQNGKNTAQVSGIAIVYRGNGASQTEAKIYELINSLYGIPYNRIYVSR